MKCNNCGNEFDPNSGGCPVCGMRVNLRKEPKPFGYINYESSKDFGKNPTETYIPWNNNQDTSQMDGTHDAPEFITYLVIGILSSLCCCNAIAGIIGIITTLQMNNCYRYKDSHGYYTYRKVTTIVYIVGIVINVLLVIFSIFISMLGIMY